MGNRRFLGRLSARLSQEERGWLIVEIMIGALVLVIAGLAIYNGLDGATKASARNRNRSVASYLAQKDQERMRSLDAATLAGLAGSSTTKQYAIAMGNNKTSTFTVTSTVTLVTDSTGSISCTNGSSNAQYLKLSSSVADPTGKNAPVVQDSLLSPRPGDGTAAVEIFDRNAKGVTGIPVTLGESPGSTVNTDSQGCSLFSQLDSSQNYDVSFSQPGYVNENGVNAVSAAPITVVPATVSVTSFLYDKAGTITATFPSTGVCAGLSVTHTNMTVKPKILSVPVSASCTNGTSHTNAISNLFPFTSVYAVFAGQCTQNDPAAAWKQTATFANQPLASGGTATATPAEPPVNLTVQRSGSTYTAGAHVVITENSADVTADPNCANNEFIETPTDAQGHLPLPGLPYGKWDICADLLGTDGKRYYATTTGVANTTSSGTSATVNVRPGQSGTTQSSAGCPT